MPNLKVDEDGRSASHIKLGLHKSSVFARFERGQLAVLLVQLLGITGRLPEDVLLKQSEINELVLLLKRMKTAKI